MMLEDTKDAMAIFWRKTGIRAKSARQGTGSMRPYIQFTLDETLYEPMMKLWRENHHPRYYPLGHLNIRFLGNAPFSGTFTVDVEREELMRKL